MSGRHLKGRHRSTGRTKTPLTDLTAAVTTNASGLGRRSAVFAASSGLAMTMGVTPAAQAEKSSEVAAAQSVASNTNLMHITAEVAVPDNVIVNLREATITIATPPPAPRNVTAVAATPETAQVRERQRPTRSHQRPAAERPATPRPAAERPATPRPAAERPNSETPTAAKPAKKPAATKTAAPAAKNVGKNRAAVLAIAARYIGVPYRYGGTTPKGFDCSGYVQYVFKQVGVSLPRQSGAQAKAGKRISAAQARPGDLVWKPGHIGIYAGNGMMYDAPRRGKNVTKRKIYFKPVYIRVLD